MMTIDQLKNEIEFLREDGLTVELFFLFSDEDEIQIKRTRLATAIQDPIVQDLIQPYLKKELDSADSIQEYDPTLSPDEKVIFEVRQSEIEQYNILMGNDIEEFDDSNGYDDIWAYMIKISKGENELVAVRKKFGSHTLKKGFSLWLSEGQFLKFERQVFTLDKNADAFLVKEKFYNKRGSSLYLTTSKIYCFSLSWGQRHSLKI